MLTVLHRCGELSRWMQESHEIIGIGSVIQVKGDFPRECLLIAETIVCCLVELHYGNDDSAVDVHPRVDVQHHLTLNVFDCQCDSVPAALLTFLIPETATWNRCGPGCGYGYRVQALLPPLASGNEIDGVGNFRFNVFLRTVKSICQNSTYVSFVAGLRLCFCFGSYI